MKSLFLLSLVSISISDAAPIADNYKIDQRTSIVISNNNLVERQDNAEVELAKAQQIQIDCLTQIKNLLAQVKDTDRANSKAKEIAPIIKKYNEALSDDYCARSELSGIQASLVEQDKKPTLNALEDAIKKQLEQLKKINLYYQSSELIRTVDGFLGS